MRGPLSCPHVLWRGFSALWLWVDGSLLTGPVPHAVGCVPTPTRCQGAFLSRCDNPKPSRLCPVAQVTLVENHCPGFFFFWEHCPISQVHRGPGIRPAAGEPDPAWEAESRLQGKGSRGSGLRPRFVPNWTPLSRGQGVRREVGLTNLPFGKPVLAQSRVLERGPPRPALEVYWSPCQPWGQRGEPILHSGPGQETHSLSLAHPWRGTRKGGECLIPPQPQGMVTSLLGGHHQGLGSLSPPLAGLGRDAEQVDGLRLEAGGCELAGAGREHLHSGGVGRSGIEPVGDLVCCGVGRGVAALGGRAGCPQGPKPEAAAASALEPLWVALTSSAAPWGV